MIVLVFLHLNLCVKSVIDGSKVHGGSRYGEPFYAVAKPSRNCPNLDYISTFLLHYPVPRVTCKMKMENTFDKTAVETIDLLEARLRRIEYAICGEVDEDTISTNNQSASKRLAELEHALHQLASKSRVVQDLLKLREYLRMLGRTHY